MRTKLAAIILAAACLVIVPMLARADTNDNVTQWGHYKVALGQPLHRVTVTATAGAPKDNTGAGAGTAYTFTGGEHICLQSTSTLLL